MKFSDGTAVKPPRSKSLKGPEKAAILFLCLGETRGSELMQKLDELDIRKITQAMAGLGVIESKLVEEVLSEFTQAVAAGGGVIGSLTAAKNLLSSFLPSDQVELILNDIRGPKNERDLWARFSTLDETIFSNYLRGEHDQTVAAILTKVEPQAAAKILPLLGQEKMENVLERMMGMEMVPGHMMRQLEETLQQDIASALAQSPASETQARIADVFNRLDAKLFEKLTPELERRAPEVFEDIRKKMFTFDDLRRLDANSLARIMRGAQGNTLPMALRGANKELRDMFLMSLPGRSRDMLQEEIDNMGPVRGQDVRTAQAEMTNFAKSLMDQGEISLPADESDDEMM